MRRFVLGAALVILGSGFAPHWARAQGEWMTVFRDDFNGVELNVASWRVFTEGQVPGDTGSYSVGGGWLSLRGPIGLPSLVTVNGIVPTLGDTRFRFGFRYGATTPRGTRIGVIALDGGSDPQYYGMHRDATVGTGICTYPTGLYSGGPESSCARFESDPPTYHVGELTFTDDEVVGTVDGTSVMASPLVAAKPNAVFFGWGNASFSFTEFDVDFVEIQVRDAPVQIGTTTWGRVKVIYR